jgi:hypothetical protein
MTRKGRHSHDRVREIRGSAVDVKTKSKAPHLELGLVWLVSTLSGSRAGRINLPAGRDLRGFICAKVWLPRAGLLSDARHLIKEDNNRRGKFS